MSRTLLAATVAHDRAAPRRIAAEVADAVAALVARPRSDVELAVHEAVANAVLHGGPPLEVAAVQHERVVEVRVLDAGRGPSVTPRPPGEQGRGRALMAASCDQVRSETLPTGGRRVRLRFAPLVTAAPAAPGPSHIR